MSANGPAKERWQRYDTTDIDEAHEFLRASYVDLEVRSIHLEHDFFALHVSGMPVGEVALSRLRYVAETELRTAANADLIIVNVNEGTYEVQVDHETYAIPLGEAVLVPPDRPVDVYQSGLDASIVNLPRDLIEQAAELSMGVRTSRLRFEGTSPVSDELGRHWARAQAYVFQTMTADPSLADNPLITGPAQRMLAAAAVSAFPNSALRGEVLPAGAVGPAVVRRAKGYIEQNASRDLTVAEIAAASGVGASALQEAFRHHESTTPTGYARRMRLEGAHADLRAADPRDGSTVAGIATRWGFTNLGRFAAAYRDAYGHAPVHTLRTAA